MPFFLKSFQLTLTCLDTIRLLDPSFIAFFNDSFKGLNLINVLVASNDVFKILKQALVIWILRFWLHERNLLNFTLQNEETVVIQVNTLVFQEFHHCLVVNYDVVHEIL